MATKTLTKPQSATARNASDAKAKCAAARELESAGDYEGAREALAGIWDEFGERPATDGLRAEVEGEVLLRVGTIAGWLGTSRQIPGAQEFAKDLISESMRTFEALGDQDKVAEAKTDLAICYWREGAMDEARVWFREAQACAVSPSNQLRVLVNSTIVESSSRRLDDALALLDRAAPLLDHVEDPAIKARYHTQRAIILMQVGGTENLDRALIENAAASLYFEQANHKRYFARVENNTGIIFLQLRRYEDALEHLDRARQTLADLDDVGTLAQVNETRAQVFLALDSYVEAEKIAFAAASALEAGGEQSLLAEALVTQGVALARMGRYESARAVLERAAQVAEGAGHSEFSGRTFLTMLEELRHFLSPREIIDLYQQADKRLGRELNAETVDRLRGAARMVAANTAGASTIPFADSSSLEKEVLKFEGEWIRRALDQAQGSVTRAAKLLGLTHQGLCYIINTRHKSLLTARAPVRIRRKSIIKKPRAKRLTMNH